MEDLISLVVDIGMAESLFVSGRNQAEEFQESGRKTVNVEP